VNPDLERRDPPSQSSGRCGEVGSDLGRVVRMLCGMPRGGVRVQGISDLRVRWLGRELEVRMVLRLPGGLTFTRAHDVAHRVLDAVLRAVPDVREVMVEPAPVTDGVPGPFARPVLAASSTSTALRPEFLDPTGCSGLTSVTT